MKRHFEDPPECNGILLRELYDKIGAAVILVDEKTGTIRFINNRVLIDLSTTYDQVVGKNYHEVFSSEFLNFYQNLICCAVEKEECSGIYYWAEKLIWEQVTIICIQWDGRDSFLITITNVSEVTRTDYEYKQIALFDGVTGLPNGRKLEEDINEIADVETMALIFFRLDSFSDIYDIYGWSAGDALLVSIRDWIREAKCRRTLLYQMENVFVMMDRQMSKDELIQRINTIQNRFEDPWEIPLDNRKFSVYCTIKIGVVYGKYVRNEMSNIILRTLNMKEKEDRGFVVYDETADREVKRMRKLRSELIDCVHNDMKNFSVNYHPIVHVSSGKWAGAEALCRWTSESEGSIPPVMFIPLLEQMGLISNIDQWVRIQAMETCASLGLGGSDFFLDVNFSPHQALDDGFVESVFRSAKTSEFPLEQLTIEITESERMRFDNQTIENLNLLKRSGAMLALDDFGTGYSSIESFIKMSADSLKTDKVMIDNIEHDKSRQYLMKTLIDMAHSFGMYIIAEGVEQKEQLVLLEKMGVDFIQGHYFSKPLSSDQFQKKIEQNLR